MTQHKLVTYEDRFHIHKSLGILCLINFTYRYCRFIIKQDMNFRNDYDIFLTISIHLLLGITSLIFRISSLRHTKLRIIYPELRLHNILFTLRSLVCFFFCYYNFHIFYRVLTCLMTSILADIISYFLKQGTTIRDLVFYDGMSERSIKRERLEYSDAQLGATIVMLGGCDMIFGTLLPIQIAPFTMTLVKKGIIGCKFSHLIYSYCLLINYILPVYNTSYVIKFGLMKIIASYMRFKYNINKYIMWMIIYYAYYSTITYNFENNILINSSLIAYVIVVRLYKIICLT